MPAHRVTRRSAVLALREAAAALHVEPAELTTGGYRRFRARNRSEERRPSDLTISLLFGSWHRACCEAGTTPWRADVEAEVRRRLYGPAAR